MFSSGDTCKNLILKELYGFPNLEQLMISEKWDEVSQKVTHIFNYLSRIPDQRHEHCAEAYHVLIYGCLRYCHERQISLHTVFKTHDIASGSFYTHSPAMMKVKINEILHQIMIESGSNKKRTIHLVHKAKRYMRAHLDGDVSLQAISDHLYLHPTTLTRLFKSETGKSIGDYLLVLRMEKAALLLQDNDLKVLDIARRLGYQSTSYFIQVFKRRFGVTPVEYRRNHCTTAACP